MKKLTCSQLIELDLKHVWHPCSQMEDYKYFPPIVIQKAFGPYLELKNGQKIIDAISSWWCKSLGHNHPRLNKALIKQLSKYEHVIPTNTCQAPLIFLSEKLCSMTKNLKHVFYGSDGSTAVEIALKMSLQLRQILGERKRKEFLALKNGYHGESLFALSLCNINLYNKAFKGSIPKFNFIEPIPYIHDIKDPFWDDCSSIWHEIEAQLQYKKSTLSGIIIEPILQAASGMRLYSRDLLRRIEQWCKTNHVHLILDEIMTGFGRTGMPFAMHYANIEPDFLCVSKGLTGGVLPMSAVLTRDEIYDPFLDKHLNSANNKAFLHSNTFSGNALAAAVALETLTILEEQHIYERVKRDSNFLRQLMEKIANKTGRLKNVRSIGFVVASDLILDKKQEKQRIAYKIFQEAVRLGAFLRPLGNTLYWTPPLNTPKKVLIELAEITEKAISNIYETSCL